MKNQIREIGDRAEKLGKGKGLKEKGKALSDKLTAIEKKLVNPDIKANQDVLNFEPALDHQFAGFATRRRAPRTRSRRTPRRST